MSPTVFHRALADARRSPEAWNDFLDCFVDDEELTARVKAKSPRSQSAGYDRAAQVKGFGLGHPAVMNGHGDELVDLTVSNFFLDSSSSRE